RGHWDARPAECLRERRAGDVARVSVADRFTTGDEADVVPRHTSVGECVARSGHAVLHEGAAPLAPLVHPNAEDGYVAITHETGFHFHTMCSLPSSSVNSGSITISASSPIFRPVGSMPSASCPSTTICSFASSTATTVYGSNGSLPTYGAGAAYWL